MSFNTNLYQNQIQFSEQIHIIDQAQGVQLLNPNISTLYRIKVYDDCLIKLLEYNKSDINFYCEVLIILESVVVNKKVIFDTKIQWSTTLYPKDEFLTKLNQYYLITLFSYDNGKHWNGSFLGNYIYGMNQSRILTPIIYSGSPGNLVSFNHIRFNSSPYQTNTGLLSQYSTSWKICHDKDGVNVIDSSFNNTTDLIFHEFDKTKFNTDTDYFAFVQYNSLINNSNWSTPLKIQLKDYQITNPKTYSRLTFQQIYYNDLRIYRWVNPIKNNNWIQTDSNNPNIIDIIDETATPSDFVLLANQYIEINGLQGLLTSIKITFKTSVGCNIKLISDFYDDYVLTCPYTGTYTITYTSYIKDNYLFSHLNLLILSNLKIIFESNCVITHIDLTLI